MPFTERFHRENLAIQIEQDDDELKKEEDNLSGQATSSTIPFLLDYMFKFRATIFAFVSIVHIAMIILEVMKNGWISFEGTNLYESIRSNTIAYSGQNAAILTASSLSALLVLLDTGTTDLPSSTSNLYVRSFVRSQLTLAFFIPSIITLVVGVSDTNRLAMCHQVGISIQSTLVVNGILTEVSTRSKYWGTSCFTVGWTVPASFIHSISTIVNCVCVLRNLYETDPTGTLPMLSSACSFPPYLLAAASLYFFYHHLKPVVLAYFTTIATASRTESRLPIGIVQNMLYLGITLIVFLSLVAFSVKSGSRFNSSSRALSWTLIQSLFIVRMSTLVLLPIVPWKITSMLKFKRVAIENRMLENNDKLRSSLVSMLSDMVPKHVFRQISEGKAPQPELHEFVVVFFCDIQGFTSFSASRGPFEVLDLITRLFSAIDTCCSCFDGEIYKVETVGDSYLAVGGLHKKVQSEQEKAALTETMARFAMAVKDAARAVAMGNDGFVKLRIGLHAGSIVTGLTDGLSPRYCVFGDTINTASRMESSGEAGRIHCSEIIADNLTVNQMRHGIGIAARKNLVEPKGKGPMRTFWIDDCECTGGMDEIGIPLISDHYASDDEDGDTEQESRSMGQIMIKEFSWRSKHSQLSLSHHNIQVNVTSEHSAVPRR